MNDKYEYKKIFGDLESEESWLTEMSEKGFALKDVSGAFLKYKYSFEPCGKKYVYRVDYNNEMPVREEITSPYVMFVTGTYGTEYVMCRHGKVYFCKAADSGDFPPVYTSPESRLAAEKKKLLQDVVFFILFFSDIIWTIDLDCLAMYLALRSKLLLLKIAAALICVICAAVCVRGAYIHSKKIKEIKDLMK